MSVEVEHVRKARDEILAALGRLLPQLSTSAKALDREAVGRLLALDANTVLRSRTKVRR
ncbi:hypothetical protein AB0J43_00085 [Nonomuraea fuscirosea]